LTKVFGSKNERDLKRIQPLVERINSHETEVQAMSDDQLKARTPKFKERIDQGEPLDDLLPEAFATVKAASLGLQGRATIRVGENDRGWTLGDLYEGNMWAGFKTSEWVSVSVGARYSSWGDVEGFDEDLNPNESPAHNTLTQSGWRVDLPVGLNFVMPEGQFEGHRLGVEFLLPIHQDLNGPQLKHRWSIAAGWSMDFSF
jgi:hypothetical protein